MLQLMNSLKHAGIDPKDIDPVVMSHAHPDHLGGCVAADGSSHFPNAQYYITQADYDFWTDQSKDKLKPFMTMPAGTSNRTRTACTL
jgi:metal-dependent hydrolase (beta-lactamase superfamily II)